MEKTSMPAEPLTLFEREEIRAGIERGEPNTRIAARLGRHRSTIGRELTRNGGRSGYSATAAETRSREQRRRPKTLLLAGDADLAWHVLKRLMTRDSPMTISIKLARGTHAVTAQISHETIYQTLYRRDPSLGAHAWKLLPRRQRCRKHRGQRATTARSSALGEFNQIADRPPEAAQRCEVGHLEGDLIIGARNQSAIITIFDRATRHCWLAGFPDGHYNSQRCAGAINDILATIPAELRRTLTWDRGSEMAAHHTITGINVYFADPHAPWQRPTNENGNRLLRRWLPKGTDLTVHSPTDLARIAHRINTIPRRSLNWDTAADRYHHAVAMTG